MRINNWQIFRLILIGFLILFILITPAQYIFAELKNSSDNVNKNSSKSTTKDINKKNIIIINSLPEFQLLILNKNRELKDLYLELKKSELDLELARSKIFPKVSFESGFSYITNPIGKITISQGELGTYNTTAGQVLIPPEDVIIYPGMENTYYLFKITIEFPLFTWGKIRNSIKLYEHVLEVSKLKIRQKKQELLSKAAIYYYSYFYLLKIIDNLKIQINLTDKLINLAQHNYDNGFITYTKFLESKVILKQIRLEYLKAKHKKEELLNMINILAGIDDSEKIDFKFNDLNLLKKEDFYFSKLNLKSFEQIKALALKNNIFFKQLEHFIEIAKLKKEIYEAYKFYKPDLGLKIELSYSGPRFPIIETGWFGNDDYNIILSIGINSSIYDSQKIYNQKVAIQDIIKAKNTYRMTKSQIIGKLYEYYLQTELMNENIEYHKTKLSSIQQEIKDEEIKVEAGSSNEIDLIKKKIDYYTEITMIYQYAINYYTAIYSILIIVNSDLLGILEL